MSLAVGKMVHESTEGLSSPERQLGWREANMASLTMGATGLTGRRPQCALIQFVLICTVYIPQGCRSETKSNDTKSG